MADNEEEMEEEDALDTAVDFRKYKIWKTIDWDRVGDIIPHDDEDDEGSEDDDDSEDEDDDSGMDAGNEAVDSDAEIEDDIAEEPKRAKTRRLAIWQL